jgi:predicted O-methyltransferase YrrM
MKNIFEEYSKSQCDICEHLIVLNKYASKCSHITEFGVRTGVSTSALITANPDVLISYDIDYNKQLIDECNNYAKNNNFIFNFVHKSTLDVSIDETDLLFIDTLHTYTQLKQELMLHHNKVKKYIIFHDTVSFGSIGEDGNKGLLFAINEFLDEIKQWKIKEHYLNNNGLMILEKI